MRGPPVRSRTGGGSWGGDRVLAEPPGAVDTARPGRVEDPVIVPLLILGIRRALWAPALVVLAAALAGCDSPNTMLDPQSEPARQITTLWWWMLAAAGVVFAGTLGFIGLSYVLRHRKGAPLIGESEGATRGLVFLFGFGLPIVVLIGVFTVANFAVASRTDAPPRAATDMTIHVTGRQWWWEVRYPGTRAVTANEVHIPVRTRVNVEVSTADVIHSFWIPQLNRKIDLVPGQVNRVELTADRAGRYEGNCAEYCGLQHAHMRMVVIAQPRADFARWLRAEAADAPAPSSAQARRGQAEFMADTCASCHQIRGTRADGRVGPDLTHLQQRATLAALTIPNDRRSLSRWIRDPQHIKRGARMPGLPLSDRQFDEILAYLEGLR